jgi:hypothetical protein
MMVEFEPEFFNRTLLSAGLSEQEVRLIGAEFSRNGDVIEDEVLLERLVDAGLDMSAIITVFSRLGIGKGAAVRMIELRQKKKLGKLVEVYTLEVDG